MQKILRFFRERKKSSIALLLIVILIITAIRSNDDAPVWITDTVSIGAVRNIVSVSGAVDAVGSADLAFPVSGIIENISVHEGDVVTKGHVLAILTHNDLKADYQDALAALRIAVANRDELIRGQSEEERDVSQTTAEIAREELVRVTKEYNDRVTNAYRTLLSTDLEAKPIRNDNSDTPPLITGTYVCAEGLYTIDTFASSAHSGYSYRLNGPETGTFSAYTESSAPMGMCGLRIQFADGESYGNSTWTVAIPNTLSSSYITNLNDYNLAVTQRTNAINKEEQNVKLAEQNLALDNADPRTEALSREEARVQQAQARLQVVNAQIQDHILTAPFDGTITNIEPVIGETVTTAPIITMVSQNAFALTALIPEIDVIKIAIGQKAEVVFDARQHEILPATVTFISPLAKEVDGVSYFEAKLTLDNEVTWLRSGLNADVDIIVESHEQVTRVPKRYVTEMDGNYSVLVPQGEIAVPAPVRVPFQGNDGFVEIADLPEGTTIIAP